MGSSTRFARGKQSGLVVLGLSYVLFLRQMFVCLCVSDRERERESCVCVRTRVCMRMCVSIRVSFVLFSAVEHVSHGKAL